MERLEQYLDRVCRGIRGPRSLRQHIRRELEEHLLDAIEQHRAAGLSEEQAVARALEHFGGPEEIRSELAEQYGERLMAVVIDKAIEWKAMTMRARWLWTTWAHLALALVIFVELSFVVFAMLEIVPAYETYRDKEWLYGDRGTSGAMLRRADAVIVRLVDVADELARYWFLWAPATAALWATFEWRVRSENKSLMRLSALGTLAIASVLWAAITAAALIVAFAVAIPRIYVQPPEEVVREQVLQLDRALVELDAALAKDDWQAGRAHALAAHRALSELDLGGAVWALLSLDQQVKIDDAREKLREARESLWDAQNALLQEDAARARTALVKFRDAYCKVLGLSP